jgi:alpha 1,3-glucosidase
MPCVVERIVILGLSAKDVGRSKEALIEPSNRRVELEKGPLLLRSGVQSTSAHVVRKPNVPISEDWSIKII